jgi:hypothetical protein
MLVSPDFVKYRVCSSGRVAGWQENQRGNMHCLSSLTCLYGGLRTLDHGLNNKPAAGGLFDRGFDGEACLLILFDRQRGR